MPVDEPLGALGQIVVRVEGALEHLAGLQRYLELAFVDIQAIDVFHPNVAVALVVKVLPGFSGVLDRIANHSGDLALAVASFHYHRVFRVRHGAQLSHKDRATLTRLARSANPAGAAKLERAAQHLSFVADVGQFEFELTRRRGPNLMPAAGAPPQSYPGEIISRSCRTGGGSNVFMFRVLDLLGA
jgi:hypothetical protein